GLAHPGGGAHRALRVPRALLQWAAAAFGARVSQPPGLRATVGSRSIGSLTQVSTKSGQVQLCRQEDNQSADRLERMVWYAWRRVHLVHAQDQASDISYWALEKVREQGAG